MTLEEAFDALREILPPGKLLTVKRELSSFRGAPSERFHAWGELNDDKEDWQRRAVTANTLPELVEEARRKWRDHSADALAGLREYAEATP